MTLVPENQAFLIFAHLRPREQVAENNRFSVLKNSPQRLRRRPGRQNRRPRDARARPSGHDDPEGVARGRAHAVGGIGHHEIAPGAQRLRMGLEEGDGVGRLHFETQRVVAVMEATLAHAAVGRGRNFARQEARVGHHLIVDHAHRGRQGLLARTVFGVARGHRAEEEKKEGEMFHNATGFKDEGPACPMRRESSHRPAAVSRPLSRSSS